MFRVDRVVELDAPADVCFEYVADFDNWSQFMFGVKSLHPVGTLEQSSGTRLEAKVQLGPVGFKSGGYISDYEAPTFITVALDRGPICGYATWRFTPTGPRSARCAVGIEYELSNGLTGRALAKVINSILDPALRYTEGKLREQVLERYEARADLKDDAPSS